VDNGGHSAHFPNRNQINNLSSKVQPTSATFFHSVCIPRTYRCVITNFKINIHPTYLVDTLKLVCIPYDTIM